jgi:hypothetical protein
MTQFVLSILASIVAGIIIVAVAGFVSTRARRLFTALTTRWLNLDIEYVFEDKDASQPDIHAELKRATTISILAGRGSELQRETFSPIFLHPTGRRRPTVRILLPDTNLKEGEYDWTMQRERELAVFDPAYGSGLLRQLVEVNVRFLAQHISTGSCELRRFNIPHIGRIVATERYIYYTPYRTDVPGRDSKVYKFIRGGEMYDNLHRLFEQLWAAGEESAG